MLLPRTLMRSTTASSSGVSGTDGYGRGKRVRDTLSFSKCSSCWSGPRVLKNVKLSSSSSVKAWHAHRSQRNTTCSHRTPHQCRTRTAWLPLLPWCQYQRLDRVTHCHRSGCIDALRRQDVTLRFWDDNALRFRRGPHHRRGRLHYC